jgi:DNA-binding GntR family transcriptional regulator
VHIPLSNSLAEELTGRNREMIIRGELPPGRPIRARHLKERFGVSHIPIREALRTLEGEGLIKYTPQHGAVPTSVSAEELIEIYGLRRLIECHAAQMSAPHYTDEQLASLETSLHALEAGHRADPHGEAFFTAHQEFHWLLLQPFAGPSTERVIRNLWQASQRYVHLSITARPQSHGEHHRDLMDAARRRDGDLLKVRLDEHLSITEDSLTVAMAPVAAS